MKAKFPGQALHILYDENQIRVLASVPCSDVYSIMLPTEATSIREIALELGKSAASVGEQIAKLQDAGLVIKAGIRKRRSRVEQLYTMSSMSASHNTERISPEVADLLAKQFRGTMREAERQQAKYLEARSHENSFRLYGFYVWSSVYLSPENSLKVREAMGNVHDLINQLGETDPENREGGQFTRVKMTTMMFPTMLESKKIIDENS
jgi:predicted transcriptional regulator